MNDAMNARLQAFSTTRTNLVKYSEALDVTASGWQAPTRASISANVAVAPNGSLTADKLVEDSSLTNSHFVHQTFTGVLSDSTSYCWSVFAKPAGRNWCKITTQDKSGAYVTSYFDVQNGVIGTVAHTSTRIEAWPEGWYRISGVFNSSTGATAPNLFLELTTGDAVAVYSGDGSSGIYYWGAQLEVAPMSSYIPTDAAAVTRYPSTVQDRELSFYRTRFGGTLSLDDYRKLVGRFGESFWDSASGPSLYLPFYDKGAGEVSTVEMLYGATPTFTRATTATTVDRTGTIVSVTSGTPRSYYDPTSLTYLGYLAEGARTNICLRSESLNTAAVWVPNNCTVAANSTVAPDGATTAELLTADVSGGVVIQTVTATGTSGSYSIWAKQGNTATQRLGIRNSTTATNLIFVEVNFSTLAISYINGSSGASAVQYQNGWIRISLSATSGITATDSLLLYAYAGDGSTVGATSYLWGAQYEEASFASSYIPTTTASATRNADDLTYPTTGWLNASTGTMFVEATPLNVTTGDGLVCISGPGTDIVRFLGTTTTVTFQSFVGGVVQADINSGTNAKGITWTGAGVYGVNDYAWSQNGETVNVDISGTLGTFTTLRFDSAVGNYYNGCCKQFAYYPRRMDNTHLQMLSKQGLNYV